MKLIKFYKNLDEQTNGHLSNYLIFLIIPTIIAIILSYGFDVVMMSAMAEPISSTKQFLSILLNYVMLMIILFFGAMSFFMIPELFKKIIGLFKGLYRFKDMIHKAANEELKTTSVDMSPNKSELKIKG